jgi:hypothetical protein
MVKRFVAVILVGIFLSSACGCAAIFVGVAGGAGTAVWLSGKSTQVYNAPYDKAVNAVKQALGSLNLAVSKEIAEARVTQIKSRYSDGHEIWIDIKKVTDYSSKVAVRVGGVKTDKGAAAKILKKIEGYL